MLAIVKATSTLLLLVGSATASAQPTDSPQCKPTGGVLFEVAQSADPKRKLVTATTTLFNSGAWQTQVFDVDKKVMRTRSGCLDRSELDGLRDDLDDAKWKITRGRGWQTSSPRFTEYKWNGKTLYTERICSTKVLDEDSQRVLDRIRIWLRVPSDLDGARDQPKRAPPIECLDNPLARPCN
jgi:hypothetical protein